MSWFTCNLKVRRVYNAGSISYNKKTRYQFKKTKFFSNIWIVQTFFLPTLAIDSNSVYNDLTQVNCFNYNKNYSKNFLKPKKNLFGD